MAKKVDFTITLNDEKGKEHRVLVKASGIKHAIAKAKLEARNKTGKTFNKVKDWYRGLPTSWRYPY